MTVKKYLEDVFSGEEYTNSFAECASEVYRVYSHKRTVGVSDVAGWLRGPSTGRRLLYGADGASGRGFSQERGQEKQDSARGRAVLQQGARRFGRRVLAHARAVHLGPGAHESLQPAVAGA